MPEWVYFCVMHPLFREAAVAQMTGTGGLQRVPRDYVENFKIPLPPLDVQKEIVAEIEGYQRVINGARAVLDHYRPHIPIHPDWPMAELGVVCDVRDGTHDSPKYVLEGYPLITSKNLKDGFIDFTDVNLISRADLDAINKRSKVDEGDLLMPMIGTIGNPVVADASREYAVKNVALIKFPKGCQVDNRFLKDLLDSAAMQDRFQRQASGSTQKFIPLGFIRKLEIPLPPLATQQAIVTEIEAEQALVAANRELITRFEQKIQATLERIWGEERSVAMKDLTTEEAAKLAK
jgi:type I restriction enzyme M protein